MLFVFVTQLNGSNAQKVLLRSVPKNMSGPFTCEVTADNGPKFYTDMDSANLTVVGKLMFQSYLSDNRVFL